jgi:hypothetical protein
MYAFIMGIHLWWAVPEMPPASIAGYCVYRRDASQGSLDYLRYDCVSAPERSYTLPADYTNFCWKVSTVELSPALPESELSHAVCPGETMCHQ